jgi:hypothetical protein
MSAVERRLVFPVGHYAGQRPGDRHLVRLGWSPERLTTDEFGVWVLAHGSSRAGKSDWTVDDVLALADGAEVDGPGDAVESLLERGLLAAVPTEPAAAPATLAFLREHRMASLLTGLGDTAENPGTYAVGVPGTAALAWLDRDAYELWQWGQLPPTLWHTCEARAKVSTRLGEPLDASHTVGGVLADLRLLLAHSCAYLDVAPPTV